jgi:uncharacterized NAD(P)/FAD-binding protein YdhS
MISRTYMPVRARGPLASIQPKHLTIKAIHQILRKKKTLTLWDSIRLLRRDLKEVGSDWRFLFRDLDSKVNFMTFLEKEIEAAQKERHWQGLFFTDMGHADEWWQALDLESKAQFLSRFHRAWMTNWVPIPITNAQMMLEMVKNHQLRYASSVKKILYDKNNNTYCIYLNSGEEIRVDWLINATGPSRFIEPEDHLLFSLLEKGFAKECPFGGLEIDFNTSSVIDAKGNKNPHLRLLGHNTTGTYYYMSTLDNIANRAKKMAEDVVYTIKDQSCLKQSG